MKKLFIGLGILAIAGLIWLAIRYIQCLQDENKPCTPVVGRVSTVGTFWNPAQGSARYKCNFFTGKTCSV